MKLRITVEGKSYEVEVEVVEEGSAASPRSVAAPVQPSAPATPTNTAPAPMPQAAPPPAATGSAKSFPSPLAGTVRGIKISVGDTVAKNQEMIVLEAMKMETSISAAAPGRVKAILVSVGDAVQSGQPLVEFE